MPTARSCALPCCCLQILRYPSLTAWFSWLIKLMLFSLLPFFSGVLQGTSLELLLPFLAASHVLCYWLRPWLWWARWIPKSSGWLLSNTIKTLPCAILFHLKVAVYLENLCTRYQKLLTSNFSPFLFCPPPPPPFFCKGQSSVSTSYTLSPFSVLLAYLLPCKTSLDS